MKKIGMTIGLVAVMVIAGGLTIWGLASLYPKQHATQTQTDDTSSTEHGDNQQTITPQTEQSDTQQPSTQQKELVPLVAEAKFTPRTFATVELPLLGGPSSASANGQWNKMQSADGALKVAIGNADGALIAKHNSKSELRTREAVRSMGRVILGQYKGKNPNGIDMSEKEVVTVPVRGTERAIEFQEVHYTYTAADGKQYRDIALVRHGAARNLFVIGTKQTKDWTDNDRAAFIRSVRVVNYAE